MYFPLQNNDSFSEALQTYRKKMQYAQKPELNNHLLNKKAPCQ